MTASDTPQQLLERVQRTLRGAPKLSFSSHLVVHAHRRGETASTQTVTVDVHCDVDRQAQAAHLVVVESQPHATTQHEIYYQGRCQYIRLADGAWRKATLAEDAARRVFALGGPGAFDLGPLAERSLEAVDRGGVVTLRTELPAAELAAVGPEVPEGEAAAGATRLLGDAKMALDVDADSGFPRALRVLVAGGEGDEAYRQELTVTVRELAPSFKVVLPSSVRANALELGSEDLGLQSADAALACWCTGCAACAACVACAACISCIACIFPPALAPVTAAAAGTAIATAVAASTAISTATATAIQQGQ